VNQSTTNKGLDDTDSDLRLTCQDINIIDPISKTRIIDPVRNTICGHVYDRGNLVAMLQRNKKTRCVLLRAMINILYHLNKKKKVCGGRPEILIIMDKIIGLLGIVELIHEEKLDEE